jgi:hypothetical protein
MSPQHLTCAACRIRVRADAPEIALLEDRCPLCGVTLKPASSASAVMGFRSFGLDALAEQQSDDRPNQPGPVDFVSRRNAASARDDLAAHRWSDDGGNIAGVAVAKWPAAH